MRKLYSEMLPAQQYASGFNPSLADDNYPVWVAAGHFGLDQGIVLMMIENHRSELIWRLLCDCPPVRAGLRSAGFRCGWL
ncbi:MAG: glucoamylase family protein [Paralcaligenes sp.]